MMIFLIIKLGFLITIVSYSNERILKMEGSGRGKEYEVMQLDNKSKSCFYIKQEGNLKLI